MINNELLVILLVPLVLGALLGMMVLRAAVDLYNRLVGKDNTSRLIRIPSFSESFVIVFLTILFSEFVAAGLGRLIRMNDNRRFLDSVELQEVALWIPISMVVMSVFLRLILRASFLRTQLIYAIFFVLMAAVLGAIILPVYLVLFR